MVQTVTPAELLRHVRALSVACTPRDVEHPENLNAAADYIRRELEGIGLPVEEQTYRVGRHTLRNLLVPLGPAKGSKIIIGAHYDGAANTPGADDNASGIAGLIELARQLSEESLHLPVTLVAYTAEEPPFFGTPWMGSRVHARGEKQQGAEIELMIALEMIGYFTDEEGSQGFPIPALALYYPTRGNFITLVGQLGSDRAAEMKRAMTQATPLPVYSLNAPQGVPGVDFSDHRSYWEEGYDAVMVTDTAFYRNRAYHTREDTPDRLDYDKMAQVVEGVHAYIKQLAAK